MQVLIDGYTHRTGEHCASTAIRNLLHFHGLELSEPMILGLASGVGFVYLRSDDWSPTRIFHGRTATLEADFCSNAALAFETHTSSDDARAWRALKQQIDAGRPAMIATDTYYLEYHNTTSHFPGHRVVVVGYDEDAACVFLADRKFPELQRCSLEELRRSRNARDYAVSCENEFVELLGDVKLGLPLPEAIRAAILRNCDTLVTPDENTLAGTGAMRALAADFPSWQHLVDWSWASRFGYQVVIKRGAGGSFYRSMYADFLEEAAEFFPALRAAELPRRMHGIAARWRDLAAVLKEQSERDACAPELFGRAGDAIGELAVLETSFFGELRELVAT